MRFFIAPNFKEKYSGQVGAIKAIQGWLRFSFWVSESRHDGVQMNSLWKLLQKDKKLNFRGQGYEAEADLEAILESYIRG